MAHVIIIVIISLEYSPIELRNLSIPLPHTQNVILWPIFFLLSDKNCIRFHSFIQWFSDSFIHSKKPYNNCICYFVVLDLFGADKNITTTTTTTTIIITKIVKFMMPVRQHHPIIFCFPVIHKKLQRQQQCFFFKKIIYMVCLSVSNAFCVVCVCVCVCVIFNNNNNK